MAPKNASRPYFVLTEVEAHACPSCHQDAPGHVVIGPDGIGFGTTYYGDEGEEEADELAEMLNDAFEKGVTQRAAREHQAAVILATALAGGGSPEQAHWMHDAAAWLNDRRAAETPRCNERAAFEKWADEQGYELGRRAVPYTSSTNQSGDYSSPTTQVSWLAWEARAAVETPAAHSVHYDGAPR